MQMKTQGADGHVWFYVIVLHRQAALHIYISEEGRVERGSEKWKNELFFLACVMIVKWHVSSVQFLDARVWNGWYFPHEKYRWLQLKKHNSRNSPDSASLHGCGNGQGFVDVFSENSTNQTVVWAVGSLNHFLNGLELHYLLHWAKDLESH